MVRSLRTKPTDQTDRSNESHREPTDPSDTLYQHQVEISGSQAEPPGASRFSAGFESLLRLLAQTGPKAASSSPAGRTTGAPFNRWNEDARLRLMAGRSFDAVTSPFRRLQPVRCCPM
jgi:hypothetical protein